MTLRQVKATAIEAAERVAIARTLAATGWNRTQAARELRCSYKTLLARIKTYGLVAPPSTW